MAGLDAGNGDIDLGAGSQAFIAYMESGGNMLGKVGGMMMLVAGLGIAVLPLWINTND